MRIEVNIYFTLITMLSLLDIQNVLLPNVIITVQVTILIMVCLTLPILNMIIILCALYNYSICIGAIHDIFGTPIFSAYTRYGLLLATAIVLTYPYLVFTKLS